MKHDNWVRKARVIKRKKPETFANNYSLTERDECDKILKLSYERQRLLRSLKIKTLKKCLTRLRRYDIIDKHSTRGQPQKSDYEDLENWTMIIQEFKPLNFFESQKRLKNHF